MKNLLIIKIFLPVLLNSQIMVLMCLFCLILEVPDQVTIFLRRKTTSDYMI